MTSLSGTRHTTQGGGHTSVMPRETLQRHPGRALFMPCLSRACVVACRARGVAPVCGERERATARETRRDGREHAPLSREKFATAHILRAHCVCVLSTGPIPFYRSVWSPRAHPYRVLSWVLGDVSPSLLRKLTFAKTETLEQTSARPAGSAIVDPAQSLRYHPARAASPRCVGRRGAGASAV